MSKVIKMEGPAVQGKKEKLMAIFSQIVEQVKMKFIKARQPKEVPEKYTFKTFLKAVLNDLITIAAIIVIGGIVAVCSAIVVLYTLVENSVILIADRVKTRRKRNVKMKKV